MAEGGPEGGAVLIARALQDSEVWGMPPQYLKLWLYLLINARWDSKPRRIGSVSVGFGQVVKSYRKIAEECSYTENRQLKSWSTSQVKRAIDWLEERDMVSTLGTELGTLITVRNFRKYQDFQTYAGGLGTGPGTTEEQPENNRGTIESKKKQDEAKRGRPKRKHHLPDDWTPNETHQRIAQEEGVSLIREAEKFRTHAAANARRLADWDAGFCNWLRRANEYGSGGTGRNGTTGNTTGSQYIPGLHD